MLEPLAATVLNSVLPTRPLASHFFAPRYPFGMAVRTAIHALPHDFFTPHPSGGKGKGKALPEHEHGLYSSGLDGKGLGPSGVGIEPSTHAPPSPRTLSTRQRTRRTSGHRCSASGSTNHVPSLRTWSRQVHIARRHASDQPVVSLPHSLDPAPGDWQTWIKTFKDVADGSVSLPPEEAWQVFTSLSRHRPPGPSSTAIAFLVIVALSVTQCRPEDISVGLLQQWGSRLQEALHHIDPGIQDMPRNRLRIRWNALHAATRAMMGELDGAIEDVSMLFHQGDSTTDEASVRGHVLEAYTIIFPVVQCYKGPHATADILMEQPWLDEYFTPERTQRGPAVLPAANLLKTVMSLLSRLEDPVRYLEQSMALHSKERSSALGALFVRVASQFQQHPYALLQSLQRRSVPIPDWSLLVIAKDLAKAGAYDDANKILASMSSKSRTARNEGSRHEYHRTALYVAARQGDTAAADTHFKHLERSNALKRDARANYLHAYAVAGDPDSVVKLFEKMFSGPKSSPPNIVHYTAVLFAFAQVGDLDSVNLWLGKLLRAGIRPDRYVYSIVLQSFASRRDVESMLSLLEQMRRSKISLTHVLYTTLISTLADRQDPLAAERIYKRAIEEGVVPDRRMVTAVMNAHVEAGSWHGVVRAFDYLNTSGRPGAAMSIEVLNTLLKAYVLIGAPFRVVANVFRQLGLANVRPDVRTFALLIQSACDSGFMEIAEDLFREMERLAKEEGQAALRTNVYVLTILMRGYLLTGRRVKAKEVLDRMTTLGLKPTGVTLGAILKAYSEQSIEQGTTVAEEFLQSLMSKDDDKPWLQLERGRRLSLETVYRPLLRAFNLKEKASEVERLHREMTEAGGEPTLGSLTALLDVHRRTGNTEGVRAIWPQIHRLGLEYARLNTLLTTDEETAPTLEGHGVAMCIPLSIYIDALSAAGDHAEVARVWKTLKEEELQFDSHNWNHLVVALVRAGEPHRAFDIVENVILKYQTQMRKLYNRERDVHPQSPLTLDLPPPEEGDLERARPEGPLHSAERRAVAVARFTKRMRNAENADAQGINDFAHPLHMLHQLSPVWNTWRPHGATLTLLGRVLAHLQAGKLVQPLNPDIDRHFTEAALDEGEIRRRTEAAGEVLGVIYDGCPRTVRLIHEYELMKRASRRGTTEDSY
ncbi:hypothetical protein BC628DRAFT_1309318 [Trametes gibbosa]|nr:hypothetical protein BC628DRAFT_1309318 [Trametes gibbosa]